MDKLLQISREGGYPMCAETLQILYDNAMAVNVLLAGLDLPDNSAVILSSPRGTDVFGGASIGASNTEIKYLYVKTSIRKGLVRLTTGSGSLQQNLVDPNSDKVVITESQHNVYDSGGNVIENVYTTERATIVSTSVEVDKWKFYTLKEVLEPAIYDDMLPDFRTLINNTTGIELDNNYRNILRKNANKLRVKLKLSVHDSVRDNNIFSL